MEDKEMISVSREYLQGLLNKIRDLENHIRGLEDMNKELVDAVNEKE